jgi:hypothetical protein
MILNEKMEESFLFEGDLKEQLSEQKIKLNRRILKLVSMIEAILFICVLIIAAIEGPTEIEIYSHLPYFASSLIALLLSLKSRVCSKYALIILMISTFQGVMFAFHLQDNKTTDYNPALNQFGAEK